MTKDGNRCHVDGTSGAILAGGAARRFGGRDKAGLRVGGARLIDRTLEALRAVTGEVIVVANDAARYRDLGVPVVADLVAGAGPLGGLYTALRSVSSGQVIVLACDMPFLTGTALGELARRRGHHDAVVPRTEDGWHPLCAVYGTHLAPLVAERLGQRRLSLRALLDTIDVLEIGPGELARLDPEGLLLTNLNTPGDFDDAVARAGDVPRHRR